MSRKRERHERERRSPTATVASASDDFIDELGIPGLPSNIPNRLEEAIRGRVEALLFQLKEAKREQFVHPLEIRLVRDAHRAVLAAVELGLKDGEVWYATFRTLVKELGYRRADTGFTKTTPGGDES